MNSPPIDPPSPARPAPAEHDALAPGTRFGEFEILRVLGVGGFGIVYLAMDHSLQREVALKEYMPAALAVRGSGPQITIRSGGFTETYAVGLRSFINEARLLARFDHPSLVKVYRFWEDNATAYMVMPYLQGRTLRDRRRELSAAPDETWLRALLEPLLGAIETLHREGVYHRDIAPDNILLPLDGGPPVLLDFGAARRVISDRTQTLTAILKPSYAPIEQYADMTQLRQGPWTDVYAVGAVLHFALLGTPPPPATARALEDELMPLARRHFAGVSQRFLLAIDWALAVRPAERPQSVEALRAALDGRAQVPAAVLQRAAVAPPASSGQAYDTTILLGGTGAMPTQADTAHQATMPMMSTAAMQPTMPMQATVPMQPTVPMATVPMQATVPMATVPQAAYSVPASTMETSILTPMTASSTRPSPDAPPGHISVAVVEEERSSRRVILWLAVALAAVLAGGLGWKFGASREPARPGPVATTPVPPATAAPTPPAQPVAQQAPAPAPVAATPAVVSPQAAAPTAPVPVAKRAPPSETPKPVPKPAAAAPPQPSPKATPPKPAAVASPAPVAAPSVAPSVAPVPASSVAGGALATKSAPEAYVPPAAAARVAVPPVPASPATAARPNDMAVEPEPQTAREACGKRVLVALWQCMERECEKPKFRDHPKCVETLNTKRQRERG